MIKTNIQSIQHNIESLKVQTPTGFWLII